MKLCATLQKVQRQYVDFDPKNTEHLEAFRILCLGEVYNAVGVFTHRQHKHLRFNLEQPFQSVPEMMFHKVGETYLQMSKEK